MSVETQAQLLEKATRYKQAQEPTTQDYGTLRATMRAILDMRVSEFNALCLACGIEPLELEPIEPIDLSEIFTENGIPQ